MGPEGSLPHSQEPATYTYTEPDRFSPFLTPLLKNLLLILSSHLRLGLPSGFLLSGFPNKNQCKKMNRHGRAYFFGILN
jgi:hypothetical protein